MMEVRDILDATGLLAEDEIDLAEAALQLARIDAPEADWQAARAHLSEIARAVAREVAKSGPYPDAAKLLTGVMVGEFGYRGDHETYDDPDNANLLRVIERRRGMPVALGILWIHAAIAGGWQAHGVNLPGHFVVGLGELPPLRVVLDVFDEGRILSEATLKRMVRKVWAKPAPRRLWPMTNGQVLLRLQGNIITRRKEAGNDAGALACIEDTLRVVPQARHLWAEAAELQMQLDRPAAALRSCERLLALSPPGEQDEQTLALVDQLRARLA